MNFSRKIVMALMPLLVVIGLRGAGQFNIDKTGGGSGAHISATGLSGSSGRISVGTSKTVFVTPKDPSKMIIPILPGGVHQYPEGKLYPPGTLVCQAEGFVEVWPKIIYRFGGTYETKPGESFCPKTGTFIDHTKNTARDIHGKEKRILLEPIAAKDTIGYRPPAPTTRIIQAPIPAPTFVAPAPTSFDYTIAEESLAGQGNCFPGFEKDTLGIVAPNLENTTLLPPAALDRGLGHADKVFAEPNVAAPAPAAAAPAPALGMNPGGLAVFAPEGDHSSGTKFDIADHSDFDTDELTLDVAHEANTNIAPTAPAKAVTATDPKPKMPYTILMAPPSHQERPMDLAARHQREHTATHKHGTAGPMQPTAQKKSKVDTPQIATVQHAPTTNFTSPLAHNFSPDMSALGAHEAMIPCLPGINRTELSAGIYPPQGPIQSSGTIVPQAGSALGIRAAPSTIISGTGSNILPPHPLFCPKTASPLAIPRAMPSFGLFEGEKIDLAMRLHGIDQGGKMAAMERGMWESIRAQEQAERENRYKARQHFGIAADCEEEKRVLKALKDWEEVFDRDIQKLLNRDVATLTIEEANQLDKFNNTCPDEPWMQHILLPDQLRPIDERKKKITNFCKDVQNWSQHYAERLIPLLQGNTTWQIPQKRLLIAQNPSTAEFFRQEYENLTLTREDDEKRRLYNQAFQAYWDRQKSFIPPTASDAERNGLEQYLDFWKDYSIRGAIELKHGLEYANNICNRPFEGASRALVAPASATEEFKRQLAQIAPYNGNPVGAAIYDQVNKTLQFACNDAKQFWTDKWFSIDSLDYAADIPSTALSLGNLALQACKNHNYVAALHAAQAAETYAKWAGDFCQTTYLNFDGVGSAFHGSLDILIPLENRKKEARAARFSRNIPATRSHYENLYDAKRHFSNFLYHLALSDEKIKNQILGHEGWISRLSYIETNRSSVVDWVHNLCNSPDNPDTAKNVLEHCDREDYFLISCESPLTHPHNIHGTKPVSYLYTEGLKDAFAMIKMHEDDRRSSLGLPPLAPSEEGFWDAPNPELAPLKAIIKGSSIALKTAGNAARNILGALADKASNAYRRATQAPPTAPGHTPAPHGHKRAARSTLTASTDDDDDADDKPPAPESGDKAAGKAVKHRRAQPSSPSTKTPGIIMDDPATALNFGAVQKLYVDLSNNSQAITDLLTAAGRAEDAAKFNDLTNNIQDITELAKNMYRRARGLAHGIPVGISESAQHTSTEAMNFGYEYAINPDAAKLHLVERLATGIYNIASTLVEYIQVLPGAATLSYDARREAILGPFMAMPPEQQGEFIGREIGKALFAEVLMRGIGGGFPTAAAARTARDSSKAVSNFARSLREGIKKEQALARKLTAKGAPQLAEHVTPLTKTVQRVEELLAGGARAGEEAATAGAASAPPIGKGPRTAPAAGTTAHPAPAPTGVTATKTAGAEGISAGKLKIDVEGLCDPASNKFNHIFDQSKHRLDRIGSTPNEVLGKIITVTERASVEGKLPPQGQFIIRDVIDGHQVEIRGAVVSGEVKYGTFFVDKDCC